MSQMTGVRAYIPAVLWLPVMLKLEHTGLQFVGSKIPLDLDSSLPGVRVTSFPAPRGILTSEQQIEAEVFGSTFADTATLASALADSLLGYHRVVMGDGRVVIVDSAEVEDPYEQAWGDPKINRFQFLATFSVRR